MSDAPAALHRLGSGPDGTTAGVLVRACVTPDGRFWSGHDVLGPEDAKILRSWPGGGHRHVAHALLTEAVRREAFVMLLGMLLDGQASLDDLKDPVKRKEIEQKATKAVIQMITETASSMADPSVREAVEMVMVSKKG